MRRMLRSLGWRCWLGGFLFAAAIILLCCEHDNMLVLVLTKVGGCLALLGCRLILPDCPEE